MKTKFLILGGLALTGVGIWYLFFKNKNFAKYPAPHSNDIKHKEESGTKHIRQVFHTAKEYVAETAV